MRVTKPQPISVLYCVRGGWVGWGGREGGRLQTWLHLTETDHHQGRKWPKKKSGPQKSENQHQVSRTGSPGVASLHVFFCFDHTHTNHSSWSERWLTLPLWTGSLVHQWNQLLFIYIELKEKPADFRADRRYPSLILNWWLVLGVDFPPWFTCRHMNILHLSPRYKNIFKATLKKTPNFFPSILLLPAKDTNNCCVFLE